MANGGLDLDTLGGSGTTAAPSELSPSLVKGETVNFTDKARKQIALMLLYILIGILIASFLALLWALEAGKQIQTIEANFQHVVAWLNIVFGPVAALVGSAVGFYFGQKNGNSGGS